MRREVYVFPDKIVMLKFDQPTVCCLLAEAKALADDIYEKLGIWPAQSFADMANKCDNLQAKIHEKDAEITSLIAKLKTRNDGLALIAHTAEKAIRGITDL